MSSHMANPSQWLAVFPADPEIGTEIVLIHPVRAVRPPLNQFLVGKIEKNVASFIFEIAIAVPSSPAFIEVRSEETR